MKIKLTTNHAELYGQLAATKDVVKGSKKAHQSLERFLNNKMFAGEADRELIQTAGKAYNEQHALCRTVVDTINTGSTLEADIARKAMTERHKDVMQLKTSCMYDNAQFWRDIPYNNNYEKKFQRTYGHYIQWGLGGAKRTTTKDDAAYFAMSILNKGIKAAEKEKSFIGFKTIASLKEKVRPFLQRKELLGKAEKGSVEQFDMKSNAFLGEYSQHAGAGLGKDYIKSMDVIINSRKAGSNLKTAQRKAAKEIEKNPKFLEQESPLLDELIEAKAAHKKSLDELRKY